MIKKVTCFYRFFGLKNAGPGLKESGIGNCLKCMDSEENKKCKMYFEIYLEADHNEEKNS